MFTKGQTIYVRGNNMRGQPVVSKGTFVRYEPHADEYGQDCVIRISGFDMLHNSAMLHADPAALRKQCRNERAARLARVDQQMAQMREVLR